MLTWSNRIIECLGNVSAHRLWHTLHQSAPGAAAIDRYAMHESGRTPKRRSLVTWFSLLQPRGDRNHLIIIAVARTCHGNIGKITINIRIQYTKHMLKLLRDLSISSPPNQQWIKHPLCHLTIIRPLWRYFTNFAWAIVANLLSESIEIAKFCLEISQAMGRVVGF